MLDNPLLLALERIVIVLVEPQNPDNIGGTVRAMMNMGLKELRVVRPKRFDPERIDAAAHRSSEFRQNIELFDDLAPAVADCSLIVAASSRLRRLGPPVLTPHALAPLILDHTRVGTPALLFGREDWGLPNDVVDHAHYQLAIPADPAYASLNLAQAVLLTAYELRQAASARGEILPIFPYDAEDPPATEAELTHGVESIHRALQLAGFYKPHQEPAKRIKLGRLLRRAAPTASEAGLLQAMGYVLSGALARRVQASAMDDPFAESRLPANTAPQEHLPSSPHST